MSAILAVIQSDRVHLLADGAFYDPETGILSAVDMKLWPIPRINAVFSSRGIAAGFPAFRMACEVFAFSTFDEFLSLLPAIFAVYDDLMRGHRGEIVIAGWSEDRNRGEVLARVTHCHAEDMEPGNIFRWTDGRVCFGIALDDVPDAEAFSPTGALGAFEAARRTPVDLHCGEGECVNLGYAVGGVLSHIEIRADGTCGGNILHCWPDVVGEKISPEDVESAAA